MLRSQTSITPEKTLSFVKRAILIENLYENGVRGGEIAELIGDLVLPLHAMEQVVSVAEYDNQGGDDTISRGIVSAADDSADERLLIVISQMKMVQIIGKGAIGEIALTEISEFRVEELRIECSGVLPSIHVVTDGTCAAAGVEEAGLEQAPQKREIRDSAHLRIREVIETMCLLSEPVDDLGHVHICLTDYRYWY